jgi:pimeloyl-ACP methyl ester carboxylesterase
MWLCAAGHSRGGESDLVTTANPKLLPVKEGNLMSQTPVVFIHGLWLHATSWNPWMELFREAGYDPIAPGWPGEPDTVVEAREHPEYVANLGINDVTGHYADIIDRLDRQPVIIGHSFGGLIAEKLLGQDVGKAAVAIDPAQIKGVLPLPLAQLRAGLPALGNPTNLHKAVSLTQKEFRFGFGNAVSEEESNALYEKWTIPSPARPLFQAASANFVMHSHAKVNTANETRGPLLLISGLEDHTVPDVVTRSTLKQYRDSTAVTELKQFEGRGHSVTIDGGWKEVADAVLDWLKERGLSGVPNPADPSSPPSAPTT